MTSFLIVHFYNNWFIVLCFLFVVTYYFQMLRIVSYLSSAPDKYSNLFWVPYWFLDNIKLWSSNTTWFAYCGDYKEYTQYFNSNSCQAQNMALVALACDTWQLNHVKTWSIVCGYTREDILPEVRSYGRING